MKNVTLLALFFFLFSFTAPEVFAQRRKSRKRLNNKIVYTNQGEMFYVKGRVKFPIPEGEYGEKVIDSWGWIYDDIVDVSARRLVNYKVGYNVAIRPGTYLVKFESKFRDGFSPYIHAVEFGQKVRRVSEAALELIYGENWNERLVIVPLEYVDDYLIAPGSFGEGRRTINAIEKNSRMTVSRLPEASIIYETDSMSENFVAYMNGHNHKMIILKGGIDENRFLEKFSINSVLTYRFEIDNYRPLVKYSPEFDFGTNSINMDTVLGIETGVGEYGRSIQFKWYTFDSGLTPNINLGDVLEVNYNDGSIKTISQCVIEESRWGNFQCEIPFEVFIPKTCAMSRKNYKVKILSR